VHSNREFPRLPNFDAPDVNRPCDDAEKGLGPLDNNTIYRLASMLSACGAVTSWPKEKAALLAPHSTGGQRRRCARPPLCRPKAQSSSD
jgi:hypothetical protein